MKEIVADPKLVAYCGLYCGACKKYLKGRCPGCIENNKATWCKVRACCIEHNYSTCADCSILNGAADCKEFNNFIARVFGFIFRSDRQACIELIKEKGVEQYAAEMAKNQIMTIRR
jgi:hypothetical protein